MIKLFMFDDDDTYYIDEERQLIEDYIDTDHSIASSQSPSIVSETSEDTESDLVHDDEATLNPVVPPRLPTNLSRCQDLTSQLELPEVTAAIESIQHPPRGRSSSRRRMNNPSNYKVFSRTGNR